MNKIVEFMNSEECAQGMHYGQYLEKRLKKEFTEYLETQTAMINHFYEEYGPELNPSNVDDILSETFSLVLDRIEK